MVDLSKIEEGDHLLVLCVFHGRANGGFWVNAPGAHHSNCMSIDPSSVVEHRPRPIAVGDKVKCPNRRGGTTVAAVIAIHCDTAWVVPFDNSVGEIRPVSDLERAPHD